MYTSKNYQNLIGIEGLSAELFKNHLTLYDGYVKHLNRLNDTLTELENNGQYETQQYDELNRRFGWEWNGMRLHEYYFENLTKEKKGISPSSQIYRAILGEFGSFEKFEKDFKSMGAIRGIGWVILYYDNRASRLFNIWVNEHDVGHLAGSAPLLVMDVFEHAYMLDYGTKKAGYIDAFMKNINWGIVSQRFEEMK